ncbi:MAG: hypothetical protein ABSF12_12995 [Bryobacteraceae bacterium]
MSVKSDRKKTLPPKPSDHPACGMWKDREDMKDPAAYIRNLRKPRYTWDDKLGVVRTAR